MRGDQPSRGLKPAARLGMTCFRVEDHSDDDVFDAPLSASLQEE